MSKAKIKKPKYLKCEDCGKENDDVEETYCPFAEEIYNENIRVTICKDCYHERCMDI